jgi:large subunit ribosomal protein L13
MKYTIDAKGKKLGRVATEAAVLLMGKESATYERNVAGDNIVEILNASKADISDAKKEEYKYKNFSGFADGLSELSMKRVIEKKGYSEIFWQAVYGMLPRNKLRAVMIKNLKVSE